MSLSQINCPVVSFGPGTMPFRIRGHSTFETGCYNSLAHSSFPLVHIHLQVTSSHPLHTSTHFIKANLWSSYSHGYSIIKIYHFPAPMVVIGFPLPLMNTCSTSLTLADPRNSFLGEETKLPFFHNVPAEKMRSPNTLQLLSRRIPGTSPGVRGHRRPLQR